MICMFIDPGHGGSDPGAVANGLQEKNLTLDIALRLRDTLLGEYTGVEVRLSRETDTTVSLKQRVQMANSWGTDYFLSIHINAGGAVRVSSRTSTRTRFRCCHVPEYHPSRDRGRHWLLRSGQEAGEFLCPA